MHPRRMSRPGLAATLFATLCCLTLAGSLTSAQAADPPPSARPIDNPIPGHIKNGRIQLELQTISEGAGLTAPNWGTYAPGVPGYLYVVDQDGPLWAVNTANGRKNKVLDTSSLLVPLILDADE